MQDKPTQTEIKKSKIHINPIYNAATTINNMNQQHLDVETLVHELLDSFTSVKKNNLLEVEGMLLSQAQTLNVFFHRCLSQVGDMNMVNQIQIFSNLAMQAQNNCRKTLLALAEVKNPKRATFIKQQNNAIGNQQINNSENLKNNSNEVLCGEQYANLDDRSAEKTITINSSLEPLEKVHGSKNNRG